MKSQEATFDFILLSDDKLGSLKLINTLFLGTDSHNLYTKMYWKILLFKRSLYVTSKIDSDACRKECLTLY